MRGAAFGAAVGSVLRASAGATPHVRVGFTGRPCEAPLFCGREAGLFAADGLSVELVRVAEQQIGAALAAGRIDAAAGSLALWLPQIASGAARVGAGLHAGCIRLLSAAGSGVDSIAGAAGAVIATERIGSPAMLLLSALLAKRGVNPRTAVRWRAAGNDLRASIASGAQVVAASDPQAFALLDGGAAAPLDDTAGGLSCGPDPAHDHQCFVILREGFVRSEPATASAITAALLTATAWTGGYVERSARIASVARYAGGDPATVGAALASYDWKPSRALTSEEIALTARDFKRAGLLASPLDPVEFAERAFAG